MGNGGGHGHGHHGHNYQRGHISVELYKNGKLTPGTKILRIGCGQKYQVFNQMSLLWYNMYEPITGLGG